MTFGEKLKKARTEAGLSQDKLAEQLMVSRSAIAKWETDKGLPDVNNLKLISQVLDVSVDDLLDDGAELDLSVIRRPIDLAAYTDRKMRVWNRKKVKDRVVRAFYPEAEICTLVAEEQLTRSEKVVDAAVFLLTPLMNVIKLSKGLNNLDNEFYLVTDGDKQYLVVVTEAYLESRRLPRVLTEKTFLIGNYRCTNCGPIAAE